MQFYPGSYDYWQIIWVQIILFVYVQLTTALALYSQRDYAFFITKPLERILPWKGRDLLVKVHAANGIAVFILNVLCTATWFYLKLNAGLSMAAILFSGGENALIGWVNLLATTFITIMGIFGISLYRNNNPNTILPFWKFEYYLSRFLHRILFFAIITVLGYHIFYINKISTAWTDWIVKLHPFSLIFLGAIVIGTAAFSLSLVMLIEIPKFEMFTGEKRNLQVSLYLSLIAVIAFVLSCLFKPLDSFASMVVVAALLPALISLIPSKAPKPPVIRKFPVRRDVEKLLHQTDARKVARYVIEAWRRGEDWRSIVDYSASLYLSLQKEKMHELGRVNEIEDIGKSIATFILNRIRELEFSGREVSPDEIL